MVTGARLEVVKVVAPPESVSVARVVVPSLKVTVPAGVPSPGELAVTLAVKVTDWPKTDGSADEVTAVLVAVELTVRA